MMLQAMMESMATGEAQKWKAYVDGFIALQKEQRTNIGYVSPEQQQQLDLARKRLELEEKKQANDTPDGPSAIIQLAVPDGDKLEEYLV